MEFWIKDILNQINRKKIPIRHSYHLIKDKISTIEELNYVEETVRSGIIDDKKSTKEKERICLKSYYKEIKKTYYVIIEYNIDSIKTIEILMIHDEYKYDFYLF